MLPRFRAERRQLGYDFGFAPALVSRYIPEGAQGDALKMVRQVNGVTTYLSWMATGEPRIFEGTVYAAAIAGMDVVTDYHKEEVGGGVTAAALDGDAAYPSLELMGLASSVSRGPDFDYYVGKIAKWQDASLDQFGDPDGSRLRTITRRKGGASALAHLHAVKDQPAAEEDSFMHEFGTTMQLLDDYLDQPGDRAEGISTLFTEGVYDRSDLEDHIEGVEDGCRSLWGDTKPVRRFSKLMRYHYALGRVENKTPIPAARLVPWYF